MAIEARTLTLPDAEPLGPQADTEVHLHVLGVAIGHGVEVLEQLGHQPKPETLSVLVGADSGLVVVKAHIGVQPRHADVDAGHTRHVPRIGLHEPGVVEDIFGQLDDIDMVGGAHGVIVSLADGELVPRVVGIQQHGNGKKSLRYRLWLLPAERLAPL